VTSPYVIIQPVNQNASVGDDVMISCYNNYSDPVEWARSVASGHQFIYSSMLGHLYTDLDPRINVSATNGFYNLTIRSVTVNDTGEYLCKDQKRFGAWESAFLNVIGTSV
jgi:hypothetical protein